MKRIEPEELRKEVELCQRTRSCSEQMGDYLLRMHNIVLARAAFFKQTSAEEEEEARSWSIQRWLSVGLWKIDLKAHPNPYSYLYRGSQLNMMNWILRERKRIRRLQEYQKEKYGDFEDEYPALQNTDHTHGND